MAAEVGVKVESTGLACWWGRDGGALRAEEAKEEEEPERQDADIVVSGRTVLLGASNTPPFCAASWCVTGTRRATKRLSGGCRCGSRPSH
jgi:hypothetical protein